VRTPLRRAIALTGLTAVVVVSGSIAAADGTAVRDITDRALATAPAPTELQLPSDGDSEAVRGLDAATIDRLRTAEAGEPSAAPRPRSAPERGDRSAQEPGWIGRASWYGPGFHGNRTASGEIYDQWSLTAAHRTLPFGTRLRVTNTANGRSVVVRINDRGPFIPGRDIDLSRAAADALGFAGVATVRIEQL
jgi:rare lipoprotein A